MGTRASTQNVLVSRSVYARIYRENDDLPCARRACDRATVRDRGIHAQRTARPARSSLGWAALAALGIHAVTAAVVPWSRMIRPPSPSPAPSAEILPQPTTGPATIDAALGGAIAVSTQPDVTRPAALAPPRAPTRKVRRLSFAARASDGNEPPAARAIAAGDPSPTSGPPAERIMSDDDLDAAAAGPGFAPAGAESIVGWARSQNTPVPRAPVPLAGRHGTVRLRIGVAADGHVRFVRVVASAGDPVLDDAAARSAWQLRFSPCTTAAGPVDCVVGHDIKFQ
jgi:TonB family protein